MAALTKAQVDSMVAKVVASGGELMTMQLSNGFYVVRVYVPDSPSASGGRFGKGYAADQFSALSQAVAGVQPPAVK